MQSALAAWPLNMNVMDLLLNVVLFAAAEHLLGTSWLNSPPPSTRLHWFLYGHPDVSLSINFINIKLFSLVQVNILSTPSVFVNININVSNFCVICLHDVLIVLCGVPLNI